MSAELSSKGQVHMGNRAGGQQRPRETMRRIEKWLRLRNMATEAPDPQPHLIHEAFLGYSNPN